MSSTKKKRTGISERLNEVYVPSQSSLNIQGNTINAESAKPTRYNMESENIYAVESESAVPTRSDNAMESAVYDGPTGPGYRLINDGLVKKDKYGEYYEFQYNNNDPITYKYYTKWFNFGGLSAEPPRSDNAMESADIIQPPRRHYLINNRLVKEDKDGRYVEYNYSNDPTTYKQYINGASTRRGNPMYAKSAEPTRSDDAMESAEPPRQPLQQYPSITQIDENGREYFLESDDYGPTDGTGIKYVTRKNDGTIMINGGTRKSHRIQRRGTRLRKKNKKRKTHRKNNKKYLFI